MKTLKYILLIVQFTFYTYAALIAQSSTSWLNYRGANVLNGISHSKLSTPLKISWKYKTTDEIKSSPVIFNNLIIVGSMDSYVYAIDLNGNLKWKYKTESSVEASPIVIKNTVFIGCLSGLFYALDINSGKLKWKFKTEGQIIGSANWFSDGNGIQILVPSYDYNLYALNYLTGKLNWKCQTDNYLNGCPATDNKKVIVGGCDSYMHIIDGRSGKEIKQVAVGTYIAESAAISENLAFVGDYDGGFTCVDLIKNSIKWKFVNPKISPFVSSPAILNDKVIIGSNDKKVYCFRKDNGKILWIYQTYGKIESSPVVLKDKVVIASNDGIIHFISVETGKKVYSYEIGTAMRSTPAIINNMLVIGGKDGTIYALRSVN